MNPGPTDFARYWLQNGEAIASIICPPTDLDISRGIMSAEIPGDPVTISGMWGGTNSCEPTPRVPGRHL